MQAAIVESPGQLRVRDIPQPEISDYTALCDILFGSICAGTDTHIVDGVFPFPVQYPTILGHESIGRVTVVGAKVRHLKVGDMVTRVGCPAVAGLDSNWGGFARVGIAWDWRAMQADGLTATPSHTINEILPAEIDPAGATMMITWRETFSFISRMGVKAGDRVLVVGSGGNGLAFVAHARNLGASSVVVGAANRREASLRAGATDFFDYRDPQWEGQLSEAFPDGFDFAIDAVGRSGILTLALSQLRPGGTLALYGLDDYGAMALDPLRARGTFTYYNGGYNEQEAHLAIVGFMRSGQLDPGLWLDLENPTPLAQINDAFDRIRGRSALKAVIRVGA